MKMHPCIICGNKKLERVISLGFHPLADTFLKKEQLLLQHKSYPLNCLLCRKCGHVQNEYFVSAEERYVENEYSYTSSNSPVAMQHWKEYCENASRFVNLGKSQHVIEFGSNDGYLLKRFLTKGVSVTGIEPSPLLAAISKKQGVYTIQGFLDKSTLSSAVKKNGKAKLIAGNNVFNHLSETQEAVMLIRNALHDDGYFVFEVPYLKDLVLQHAFDTIYHEHISYFSVKSADYLLKKHGLYIARIEHNDYQGGSLRVYSCKDKSKYNKNAVAQYVKQEEEAKLFSMETYSRFMAKITEDKWDVLSQLLSLKKEGKRIAAIGAATKGNTLLNFYRLDSGIIDFVTDVSPYKIGKYMPGSFIPIVHDNLLSSGSIDAALILPWNIGKMLVQKIKKIHPNLKFIVPGEKGLI